MPRLEGSFKLLDDSQGLFLSPSFDPQVLNPKHDSSLGVAMLD
jgi:hypothetical protein